MVVLLAGAGGQLGRDLQMALAGVELHALDHAQLDIGDRAAVQAAVRSLRPDWVINAAAFNDVDGAEAASERAFVVNGAGPGYLAEAARRAGAALLHVSTDYVFDGQKPTPYLETDEPNPLSVYARSKYEGERRVLDSGGPAIVVRTAWLYGEHGNNFVQAILAAAEKGGPVRVVQDQVGSPTATRDLAEAIAGLIKTPHLDPPPQGGRGISGIYHIVNAGACSRYEFAQAIVRDRVELIPITTAEAGRVAKRPPYSALASVRWEATGLPPLAGWREALGRFLSEKQAAPH